MTTEKQKQEVHFCEQWLHIEFDGNLENEIEVQEFLDDCLSEAELAYQEIKCEYEAYLFERL